MSMSSQGHDMSVWLPLMEAMARMNSRPMFLVSPNDTDPVPGL